MASQTKDFRKKFHTLVESVFFLAFMKNIFIKLLIKPLHYNILIKTK
jgi:hypothetical protein